MWEIEVTDEFEGWWRELTTDQQASLGARIELLETHGPDLGRPAVDRIHASRHQNMKELRASAGGALRVLFVFDPRRHAILLVGGDKSDRWTEWYWEMIPLADDLCDRYLEELQQEGLL